MTKNSFSLNKIEISKSRLLANANRLMHARPGVSIAPVLKSNAYGHGIELIGSLLDSHDFPFYCVNSLEEADLLKASGIKTKILIMGYVHPHDLAHKQLNYSLTVFDIEQAEIINKYQKNPRVHLNIETGLNREGLDVSGLHSIIEKITRLRSLRVEGVMSHLACSGDPGCDTTIQQLASFKKVKALIKQTGLSPKWYHLGGSLALLNGLTDECNVVRCGRAFFGIGLSSTNQTTDKQSKTSTVGNSFAPVLSLKSTLVQIKKINKGNHVSYADSFVAQRDMTIGILPIGYSDGIDRRLSNTSAVFVGNVECKIIGVIAMNDTIIDLTNVPNPKVGQEVIVFSASQTDPNSLNKLAKLLGTLPYESVSRLPRDMHRELVE